MRRALPLAIALTGLTLSALIACGDGNGGSGGTGAIEQAPCELVESGYGPKGKVPLAVDKVVTDLEVPWGLVFLPDSEDWLVTERPGRVRLIRSRKLLPDPVLTLPVGESGEGGLLGIALDPDFGENRLFSLYYTLDKDGKTVNRVERFRLSADHRSAVSESLLLDDIPAGAFHDGGRIEFGPDGKLYVATGDARDPESSQDPESLNGKILRLNPDGTIPDDNPRSADPVFVSGLRNPEAFDWVDEDLLLVADHGPTGELGLDGRDEVSFASGGANLGWPRITGCEKRSGLINPILSFMAAAPPGGGVIYRGSAIPEFDGDFLVAMLGTGAGSAMQLHRIVFDKEEQRLVDHEVYLQGEFGRLRDVTQGPDGALYVTTSNCDSRGTCPSDGDAILRITRK